MPAIALVVEIRTQPGQRDACRGFEILLAEEEPDSLVLYEAYQDEQALEEHDAAPYFQAYREDTAAMIASRRRILCRPANE